MDCRDCLDCKVILAQGKLRCKTGEWTYEKDGTERTLSLTNTEIRTANINKRKIFCKQKDCQYFVDNRPIGI